MSAPRTARPKAVPVIRAVTDDDVPDITALPPLPEPARAAKPRQVTRAKLIITVVVVSGLLALRYHSTPMPGRTMAGHGFWFLVQDAIACGVILWAWTGFAHRSYRDRGSRRYAQASASAHTRAASARQRWIDHADRPRGPGPTDVIEDDGPKAAAWTAWPGAQPAGAHARRARPAPARGAAGGRAPAEWQAAAGLLDVDGENGQEVLARLRQASAGLKLVGGSVEELHHHLTVERGYDERALPSLGSAGESVKEASAQFDVAFREVSAYYEHLLTAADDGIKGPHDGHEFEE